MAQVTPADRWTGLVRETLAHLQSQLDLMGDSRSETATLPEADLLLTPPVEPRNHKGLLSPFTLLVRSGGQVHVPFWAIARDYKMCVELPASACRGCWQSACAHEWPPVEVFDPAAVVVLRLREGHDDCAHGWYLRVHGSKALIEMPRAVRRSLIERMGQYDELRTSQLLIYNAWSHGGEEGFHEQACERFQEYRVRVRQAVSASKKRTREDTGREADYMAGEPETCVVCLEDTGTARGRCRADTCSAKVCAVCHADSRGLCPICDRSAINADYPCGRCYENTHLRQYGYECIGCGDHTLCKPCYSKFRECCACESG